MSTSIQLLRSATPQLRPDPGVLSDGMPMLNTHESEPGLFFRLRDGSLSKIGPIALSVDPPNSGAQGYPGNCVGEAWVDTSLSGSPLLKVWDGGDWVIPFQSPTAVTSVGLQMPSGLFGVANSPVTSAGTLSVSLLSQPVNRVFAGPSTGVASVPSFRLLEPADIPDLDASKLVSGTIGVDRVPALPASKVTSGVFSSTLIPGLDASKITSGSLPYSFGGTGVTSQPINGELLIGGISTGWNKATLTAGNNITITNGAGSITITAAASASPGGADTQIQFNSSGVIAGDPDFTYDAATSLLTLNGDLTIGGTGQVQISGQINLPAQTEVLFGDSGANSVALRAPATVAASFTLDLPDADGAANEVLVTDGAGALSFTDTPAITYVRKVETVSTTATIADTTEIVFATASADYDITLPTATAGRVVSVVRTDATAFTITLIGTVDGVVDPATYFPPSTADRRVTLVSDGTDWYTLSVL